MTLTLLYIYSVHANAVPQVPDFLQQEAVPGNIRRAEHFLSFMKKVRLFSRSVACMGDPKYRSSTPHLLTYRLKHLHPPSLDPDSGYVYAGGGAPQDAPPRGEHHQTVAPGLPTQVRTTFISRKSHTNTNTNPINGPAAPSPPLHSLSTKTALEVKPLKFTYSRLNSLLRTLEVTHLDEYNPLQVRRYRTYGVHVLCRKSLYS